MFLPSVLKHAPWSISKVGVIERCTDAFKYKHVDKWKEDGSSRQSKIGVAVHSVLELGMQPGDDATPKTNTDDLFEKVAVEQNLTTDERDEAASFLPSVDDFIARIQRFCRDKGVKQLLIEYRLGMNADFTPASFWDKTSLMRGVMDLAMVTKDNVLIILDHKTGKPKPITDHYTQFYTYMLMGSVHFPDVTHVQCAVHYVGNPKLDWMPAWSRAEVDRKARPWLEIYLNKLDTRLQLVDAGTTTPEVGWQCEYCGFSSPVRKPDGSTELLCLEGSAEVARRRAKRAAVSENV